MATEVLHTNGSANTPKITFYTNPQCPYAHRSYIALKELGLPFEEVIIDLERPRDPWFLEINPRGMVPAIIYSDGILNQEIVTESQIIPQFLADTRPSHLAPTPSSSPTAALFRARMTYFMDTWNAKIMPFMFSILRLDVGEEWEAKAKDFGSAFEKEIEPLLADADPFFGGSKDLTLVECHCAPFLVRFHAMCDGHLYPKTLKATLEGLPNLSKWSKAVMAKENVTSMWDEALIMAKTTERVDKMREGTRAK